MKMKVLLSLFLMVGLLWSQSAMATNAETKAFRQTQKDKWKQFSQQQKEENKAFQQTLKEMKRGDRNKALEEHHKQQQEAAKNMREQIFQENKIFMDQKLAENNKLKEDQRTKIEAAVETRRKEQDAFREKQKSDIAGYIQKVSQDASMTPEQRKTAIQQFMSGQYTEQKAHQTERKAKWQELRNELNSSTAGAKQETAADTQAQKKT